MLRLPSVILWQGKYPATKGRLLTPNFWQIHPENHLFLKINEAEKLPLIYDLDRELLPKKGKPQSLLGGGHNHQYKLLFQNEYGIQNAVLHL
jgi:hypothetical protein